MSFFIENWALIVAAIAVVFVAGYAIYVFVKMPRTEQLNKVQEWLLWAVISAEKSLGSGTGKVKLRYCYDSFVKTFPDIAKVITFEAFSLMVDQALETMRKMLAENKAVKEFVEGGKEVAA